MCVRVGASVLAFLSAALLLMKFEGCTLESVFVRVCLEKPVNGGWIFSLEIGNTNM